MKFEQALQAMREGKRVKRPIQYVPRTIKDGMIVEVYKDTSGNPFYEPIYTINIWNIIAEDWEIVENEQKS